MEKSIPICEADNAMLKQKALSYLPRNLGEMEAHQQILVSIARTVPEVSQCSEKAEHYIWPKVKSGEIPVNRAIAQCAYEANTAIGSAIVNTAALQALPEEALMEAWIALDYYGYVLKADYAVNIRNLQNHIGNILLHPQPVAPVIFPEDLPDTAPAPEPFIPPTAPIDPIPVEPVNPTVPIDPVPMDTVTPTIPVTPIPDPQPFPTQKKKKSGKGGKAIVLVAVAAVLCVVLLTTFVFNDVRKVEQAISKIGTVTLGSAEKIENAEQLYNELDADQQENVENSDVLFASRAEYDALVTDDAIEKIGTVTMNSREAIEKAETLYDALPRDARNLVKNYKTLTAARKEYTRLETAIQKASDAIDAIGTVTLDSGSAIKEARSAYDALKKDDLQSHLSNKVSILTAAETEYENLYYTDVYDTGIAYTDGAAYEDAINCFDIILVNCSNSTIVQNARDAKAIAQIELARAACKQKDYYTATMTLRDVESRYQNLESYLEVNEQLLAALKKNRPNNKTVVDGKIDWGYCNFQLTAGDQDVCFKLQNTSDPTSYKLVYVRAGQSVKVNVEDGTYSIKWATGEYWYGKDHMFGPDTVYKSKGTVNFETTRDGRWIHFWYLDLNLADNPTAGSTIDANNF